MQKAIKSNNVKKLTIKKGEKVLNISQSTIYYVQRVIIKFWELYYMVKSRMQSNCELNYYFLLINSKPSWPIQKWKGSRMYGYLLQTSGHGRASIHLIVYLRVEIVVSFGQFKNLNWLKLAQFCSVNQGLKSTAQSVSIYMAIKCCKCYNA